MLRRKSFCYVADIKAGEGFGDPPNPSTEPGARILCTHDGGKTWNRTFWAPQTASNAFSLMELRFANATEIWAVGAMIAAEPRPMFVHSSDGGQTWTTDTPAGMFGSEAMSISMVTPEVGYAVVLNGITQAASIAKYGGV